MTPSLDDMVPKKGAHKVHGKVSPEGSTSGELACFSLDYTSLVSVTKYLTKQLERRKKIILAHS